MLFGGTCDRMFLPYFVQYLQPVGFFLLSLLSPPPLFWKLWALRDVVRFLQTGGDGDRNVEGEGERRLCLISFSFCLSCPLLGAGPSLSVVVAAFALSLEMYDWYCGAGCCFTNCWSLVTL